MNDKEQEEILQRLLDCLDSGNFTCGCEESGCGEIDCLSEDGEDFVSEEEDSD
jgi:hypothetical protein